RIDRWLKAPSQRTDRKADGQSQDQKYEERHGISKRCSRECPLIASAKTHPAARFRPSSRLQLEPHEFVLTPSGGGLSARLGALFGGGHPILVFFVVMFGGLAAIAALSIGLGLFVTHVVET